MPSCRASRSLAGALVRQEGECQQISIAQPQRGSEMMIAENLYLCRRILRLIALEQDPTVVSGNAHLAPPDALAMRCMISPDGPAQIVLSQISCQRAIKGLGQSDVERPRYQSEIRKTLQCLEQGRVGHTLGGESPAWNHDTSIGCAWDTHQLPLL